MKPKNKFQAKIVQLSGQLSQITTMQKEWAFDKCFDHIARATKQGKITCLECAGEWNDKTLKATKTVCPHCSTPLTVKQTRAYTFKNIAYFSIVDKCEEFQVLRYFYVEQQSRKGKNTFYYIREVVQRWIAPNGKYATLAMLRPLFGFSDYWLWSSELELRPEKQIYDILPTKVYPKMQLTPQVKRNGFKSRFHNLTPFEMFHTLITNNRAETLLKAGQTEILRHFVRKGLRNIDTYWSSIRIAIRNGYKVKDGSMWCDYIDLLNYFQKDVQNAKYVCPDKLKLHHDRLVEKKLILREQEQSADRRRRAMEDEEKFKELKSKFFGISFTDGAIEVRVLESVQEHFDEGKAMKHCVSSYHSRANSLIFSATINGKRIETIEVSLETLKVIQCRGICNQNTEYHDQIINLVNSNKRLIQQRLTA